MFLGIHQKQPVLTTKYPAFEKLKVQVINSKSALFTSVCLKNIRPYLCG
jgi:hypothetical protein